MSESNLTVLRVKAESAFGTTPASPAFKDLLVRSSSLKYEPQTITDDQISGDRSIRDANLVGYDVSGDIQARITFGALDEVFESMAYSTWTSKASLHPTEVDSTKYTVASGGAVMIVGTLVKGSGHTVGANNGLQRVTAVTATEITVSGDTGAETTGPDALIKAVGMADASGATGYNHTTKTLTFANLNPTNFGIVAGMWLKLGGSDTANKFATAGCNGFYRVGSVTSTTIVFDITPVDAATDAGTGKVIFIFIPEYLRDASTRKSLTLERQYTNTAGTNYYEYFRGCVIGQGRLQMQPRQNIEANFEVMGLTASVVDTTRLSGATTVAPVSSAIMNTSSNVAQIRAGGTSLSGAAATVSANITLNNNLRTREGIGSQSIIDVRAGRFDAQVEMTSFFENTTQINKVRNDEETSFDTVLLSPARDTGYVLDFPRGKYTAGEIQTGRIDTDITTPLTMQALRHTTLGYTMQLARFNYLQL